MHRIGTDKMEHKQVAAEAVKYLGISEDQLEIMQGALDMQKTKVEEAMTPLDRAYMLPNTGKLDANCMADILAKGFSRIPVYDSHPHNVCGLLL